MTTPKRVRNPSPPSTTFKAAVARYINEGGRELHLGRLVDHFGPDITIAEIDEAAIARAVKMIGQDLKPSTVQSSIVAPIKIVLNHAFDTGRKRGEGRKPARWLTPDEVEALIVAASDPARIGLRDPHRRTLQKIAFMLGTGAAPGEVISIDAKACDPETGEWSLPGIPSMIRPRRMLPPPRATALMGDIPSSGPAFLAPNGEAYVLRHKGGGQMAEAFAQVRQAAGLGPEVTPATLRTTWAVWLYAQAEEMEPLIGLGGWAGPRSAKPLADLAEVGLTQWLITRGWDFRDSIAFFQWDARTSG